MRPYSAAQLVCFAVGIALTTGCLDGSIGGSEGSPPSTVTFADAELPLLEPALVDLGPDFAKAENVLAQTCMQSAGFEYPAEVFISSAEVDEIVVDDTRPPPIKDWAPESEGYRRFIDLDEEPSQVDGAPADDFFSAMGPSELAAWERAFFGTTSRMVEIEGLGEIGMPNDGCLAEARLAIWGSLDQEDDWERQSKAAFVASRDAAHRATADSRYRETVDGWSDCMNDLGYQFESPDDAIGYAVQFLWPYPEGHPLAESGEIRPLGGEEISLATSDKDCQLRHPATEVMHQLHSAYQHEFLASDEGQALLLALKERRSNARETARELHEG